MRAIVVALSLVVAVSARADLDRTKYRELPGGEVRTRATITSFSQRDPTAESCDRYVGQRVSGDYDVFINTQGTADAVDVIRSIDGCDRYIAKQLMYGRESTPPSEPFVRHVTIELAFTSATISGPGLRPKNVPPHVFDTQTIEREPPHLSDAVKKKHPGGGEVAASYYVTVGTDGHVTAVDPMTADPEIDGTVIETLKRWRFKPQPIPIRTMLRFVFAIPAQHWR